MSNLQHIQVRYPEPHLERMKKILTAHPDVKKLYGNNPNSAFWVFGLVLAQIAVAIGLAHSSWWLLFIAAYTFGAFANHALWVLIHECTHNLVFKTRAANSLLQIFANLPIVFPSAMSFRTYHLQHHLHQGDFDKDADLPRPFEARWIGNSFIGKSVWMFFFFASQLVRVPFLKGIKLFNAWTLLNTVVEFSFLGALTYLLGWKALAFLGLSSVFSIGLHPMGARWIQEHYVVQPNQETYSYYGQLNRLAFNVGYHNEHHDFMRVSWRNLPKLRALAPEFYDILYFHTSWPALLWRFLTDRNLSLYSRVIRPGADKHATQEQWPVIALTRGLQNTEPLKSVTS
jgi:sphingolipid delta-4 desaturase